MAAASVGAIVASAIHLRRSAEDANRFSIYVLGGSTALGNPYNPRLDFGKIVSWLANGTVDGRTVEVVNLAWLGKTATLMLRDVEKVKANAGVVFLYCGHNEFLRLDRGHDLSQNQRTLADEAVVPAEVKERLLYRYEQALRVIVRRFRDLGIPLVLSTAVANTADWEPNRSVLRNPENEQRVRELMGLGEEALNKGHTEDALAHYRGVLGLEPTFALAHKKAGDCYRRQRKHDDARRSYRDAADHDGNPTRVLSRQNDALRRIAREYQVPLVEAVEALRRVSPDGLVGYNIMWDNCHPLFEGYVCLAARFAERMQAATGVRLATREIDHEQIKRALRVDDSFLCDVLINRSQFCYGAAILCYDRRARLDMARRYLEAAARIDPGRPAIECCRAVRLAIAGDRQGAIECWRRAFERDRKVAEKCIQSEQVKQLIRGLGIENPRRVFSAAPRDDP